MADAHGADKKHAGLVAVADRPADEVGVRLAAESGFGDPDGGLEGGRVGGVLEGVETAGALFVGQVEFAGRGEGKVMVHDTVNLLSHWLDRDWNLSVFIPGLSNLLV